MSGISQFIINFISTVLFSLVIYHIGEKGGYSRGYQAGYRKAIKERDAE